MLKYLTSGESHGPQLTVIVDGFPAGFHLEIDGINFQLARRQKGFGRGERMTIEHDQVEIVSGLRGGITLGSPVTLVIKNRDWPNWEKTMSPTDTMTARDQQPVTHPRPGHADLAGAIKYHHQDIRNVLERASARETAARVAAGALTRQLLEHFGVQFASHVIQIGQAKSPRGADMTDLRTLADKAEQSPVRCVDTDAEKKMMEAIKAAMKDRYSLGGVIEVIVRGVPPGLGSFSQADRRLDAGLAASAMSIPSVKGVEIGLGFASAGLHGAQAQDEIYYSEEDKSPRKGFYRKTNRAGGIEGGISNGEDIVLRLAVKPVSTQPTPLQSVDIVTREPGPAAVERTDTCVVPAVAVVAEAVVALTLAEAFLEKFGSDNITEIRHNFRAFTERDL